MPKLIAVMPIKKIEKLESRDGKHHKIAVAPSLYLHLSPTGGRSWIYRYAASGRKIDMGLGSYRELSRDDAMAKARALQDTRKAGVDPLAARRNAVAAAAVDASKPTFRQVMVEYHAEQKKGWGASHARGWLLEMEREIQPLMEMKIDQITMLDVRAAIVVRWSTHHETVSRCRGRVEQTWDYAKGQGHCTGENPARMKGGLAGQLVAVKLLKKVKGEKHHPAIDYADLPEFMRQLPDTQAGCAVRFLVLTGQRTADVRELPWSEIDLKRGVWTLPASRQGKTGRANVLALSAPALALLEAQPTREGLVFPGLGKDSLLKLIKALGGEITSHGMRATFSTWANDTTNHHPDLIEACLGHLVGNKVSRAYARGDQVERKREVSDQWARFISGDNTAVIIELANRIRA